MKKRIAPLLFVLMLMAVMVMPVLAAEQPLLVDQAGLLSDYEAKQLEADLEQLSHQWQLSVVIVTTDSLYGKTPRAYADDFYDENSYGWGADHDGVLLLVSMEDRDWYISTCGYGIRAFTDAGIDYIGQQIVPTLSDGDYAGAFEEFIGLCDDFITQAKAGKAYDSHNLPKEPFRIGFSLSLSLIIGLAVGLITAFVLKGQLKSVRKQHTAVQYVQPGSLRLTETGEFFLYHTISKVEKPKDNGGSGTHFSSSGRSHGGGGGKF